MHFPGFAALAAIGYLVGTLACAQSPRSLRAASQASNEKPSEVVRNQADSEKKPDPTPTLAEQPAPEMRVASELDAFEGLKEGDEQLRIICARQGDDLVRQVFCRNTPPTINSLRDLQSALGIAFGEGNDPQFSLTGHSSSLVARFVNSINPRAIVHTRTANNIGNLPYVALGFVRGEQFVELIANDPNETNPARKLKFFLVHFQQQCNEKEEGCSIGELLTPSIESNWLKYTIYEDEDLKNTIFDCRHCHQPEGLNSPTILRMQELRDPWTHFMRSNRNGGRALLDEYMAAHGNAETYSGIPGNRITNTNPARLEDLVRDAGFGNQPNEFDSRQIENNGNMQAWQQHFDIFAAGQAIAPPYHGVNVSDPSKLLQMSNAYVNFRNGTISESALPDIRDTFKDEDAWAMGFAVRPGSTGQQIMLQACAQCHNAKLDQSISRAKFDIDLSKMDKVAIDTAIARIMLPANDPKRMPPHRFRDLTEEQKETLINHLRASFRE
jgi:mono/diheme cytochrome c family protein